MVGARVRRLRNTRGLSLHKFSSTIYKPEGGHYSGGYFSRLERGWSTAPLYVYLAIAAAFAIEPGRLLGMEDLEKQVTEAEMTLVYFLRRMDIEPHDALARLWRGGSPASTKDSGGREEPGDPAAGAAGLLDGDRRLDPLHRPGGD